MALNACLLGTRPLRVLRPSLTSWSLASKGCMPDATNSQAFRTRLSFTGESGMRLGLLPGLFRYPIGAGRMYFPALTAALMPLFDCSARLSIYHWAVDANRFPMYLPAGVSSKLSVADCRWTSFFFNWALRSL